MRPCTAAPPITGLFAHCLDAVLNKCANEQTSSHSSSSGYGSGYSSGDSSGHIGSFDDLPTPPLRTLPPESLEQLLHRLGGSYRRLDAPIHVNRYDHATGRYEHLCLSIYCRDPVDMRLLEPTRAGSVKPLLRGAAAAEGLLAICDHYCSSNRAHAATPVNTNMWCLMKDVRALFASYVICGPCVIWFH